MTWKSTSSSG